MKKNEKRLSIIIVTYNRANEVVRAINSCLRNIISDSEIIIWDNGSDESNKRTVELACNSSGFPIRYYYSKENLGPGGGKNAAWKVSCGEYVYIMDDDAVIESKNFFEELVIYMDENEHVGASYVNIYEPSTNWTYKCELKQNQNGLIHTLSFVGGGHIIRKSAFPQENLYPTKFMFGSEEFYASLLLWNAGYEIHEVNRLTVLHLPTATNRMLGKERDKMILVSSYIVKKMLYPVYILPVVTLLFRVRIKKNNIKYSECKKLIEENINNGVQERLLGRTIWKLMKKFGVIPLI